MGMILSTFVEFRLHFVSWNISIKHSTSFNITSTNLVFVIRIATQLAYFLISTTTTTTTRFKNPSNLVIDVEFCRIDEEMIVELDVEQDVELDVELDAEIDV